MKESLSYKVLITMQKRHRLKQNAVLRGESFEADNSYHYDGAGKRLSDLCNYGYAERKGDDHNGYMLYQVSEKGLGVRGFKDFKENTLKMKQYRASAKKTREESAVKKECKIGLMVGVETPNKIIGSKAYTKVTEEEYKAKEIREQADRDNLHNVIKTTLLTSQQPRYKKIRDYIVR